MKYNFDRIHDRKGTHSLKWDFPEAVLNAKDVLPLWVADMDFESPPEVIDAVRKRADHGVYGYPLIPASFWEASVRWLEVRHNWRTHPEWMAKSPGVVPALHLLVRALTEPGDEVVIQTPVYRPFYDAIEKNGRLVARNPLTFDGQTWRMDLANLKKRIGPRTRLIILCSPHNPVGRVWTAEELEEFGAVCAKRDLTIVSDEIHGDFIFGGRQHVPLASLSAELAARTVTCTAPNKTFNLAGLTTGIVIASNARLLDRYKAEAEMIGLHVANIFGIEAFEAAFRHGDAWLDELLAYLQGNIDFCDDFFSHRAPGIRFLRPEGTYLALLDCRELGLDQAALDEFFLRKAKVYFEPGLTYGEELKGFERLNFGCPRPILAEALERVEAALVSAGLK